MRKTTDKFTSMRPKIKEEFAVVAKEVESKGLTWCQRDVKRLITPYPPNKKVDRILVALAEDHYHDDIHAMEEEVDEVDEAHATSDSDVDDELVETVEPVDDELVDEAADGSGMNTLLSAEQADEVHKVESTIAALEATIDTLRAIGAVRGVQCIQDELDKEKRKVRTLVQESPAVAESFLRLRRAEDVETLRMKRLADQQRERKRDATIAIADKDAAVAELRQTKRKIQEMESVSASKHALKTFTMEALGDGSANAGGGKGKKKRSEVLDRLRNGRAGLSAGQKNDWPWFKEAWDK